MGADLALQLRDLPTATVAAILDLLQDAYVGTATVGVVVFNRKEVVTVGEITVNADETGLTARVTALDSEGNQTTFDAAPTWESSDELVAACRPDEDGYTCGFDIGQPGSAAITCTGIENSSGSDVEIVSSGLINVVAGDAVVGSIEFAVDSGA